MGFLGNLIAKQLEGLRGTTIFQNVWMNVEMHLDWWSIDLQIVIQWLGLPGLMTWHHD